MSDALKIMLGAALAVVVVWLLKGKGNSSLSIGSISTLGAGGVGSTLADVAETVLGSGATIGNTASGTESTVVSQPSGYTTTSRWLQTHNDP